MSNESLFVAAFVYLLAAVVSVSIFKKLGLSSVLGYLVAGVVIGPFGLGFVGSEGEDVRSFAEFGVVMMLFLIGLELKPSLLWRLRWPILGLGGGQVVLTTGAFTVIGIALGLDWRIALTIGMAFTLSSTVIALQALQEQGQMNGSGGRSGFAVLLFQDIAVIPMLAVIPLLATMPVEAPADAADAGNAVQAWLATQPGWVNTVMVLLAVVGIILAGRYLLRPVLRVVAQSGVREAFVALALVLVIGIALLMSSLGVSAAMGTFLAGVVLADSEYRHELEADIEPFKGLLLGVFFIAVGASIDFGLVAENPGTVAGTVIGLIVVKIAVLMFLGALAKLILDQRFLFSFSIAAGSEFAFVVLGFALTSGVMSGDMAQILIASVALSMAMAPILMIIYDKVLRVKFGTKVSEEKEADEVDQDSPVILAGVGRFGNFIARMLIAQKIPVTVIDGDADHVEFLRKLGIKTFYGDVSRPELLHSAGAADAKLLIIAIDDEGQIAQLLQTVEKHFPDLEVMVRGLSRQHEYEMIESGVSTVVHQHAGSAIFLAEKALCKLGYRCHQSTRIAKAFAKHDLESTHATASVRSEEKKFIEHMRLRMDDLETQFEAERNRPAEADLGWDSSKLREDTKADNYSDIVPEKS